MTDNIQPAPPHGRVPPGGEGLVGLLLTDAEATLQDRGHQYGVYRHLAPGSARVGPFRNRLTLHIDENETVTDVSTG